MKKSRYTTGNCIAWKAWSNRFAYLTYIKYNTVANLRSKLALVEEQLFCDCEILWLWVERRRSTELFPLSKVHLIAIVWVHIGLCSICVHTVRLEVFSDTSWMEESAVEISRHFLLHSVAFARLRLKHLGSVTC